MATDCHAVRSEAALDLLQRRAVDRREALEALVARVAYDAPLAIGRDRHAERPIQLANSFARRAKGEPNLARVCAQSKHARALTVRHE